MVGVRGSIPLAPTIPGPSPPHFGAGFRRQARHGGLARLRPNRSTDCIIVIADDGVHRRETIEGRPGALEPCRRTGASRRCRPGGCGGYAGRDQGQARRLGDALRDSARRRTRAMRDRAQRRRPGAAESDPGRHRAQHRRSQGAAHAGDRAARGAAPSGRELADRRRGRRAFELPAVPPQWLRRPARHGRAP